MVLLEIPFGHILQSVPKPPTARPTLKDVAREAGVSLSTVSYVLNDNRHAERISVETKERVRAAVERLGYKLDPVGRALQRGYTHEVFLLIVTWNLATSHAATAMAISRAAIGQGFELTVHVADDDAAAEAFLRRRLLHNIGGILVLWDSPAMQRSYLNQLADEGVPVIDLLPGTCAGISTVTADRRDAGLRATEHLIQLGHRRIGFIGDFSARAKTTGEKLAGYKQALEQAGIAFDAALVQEVSAFGFDGGQRGFLELVRRCPDLTGVFCINDPMALGAIAAADSLGRACPGDVSVIGFGAAPEGEYTRPKLTTVALSPNRVAAQAIDLLTRCRREESSRPQKILIPEDLVLRESTASVRQQSE